MPTRKQRRRRVKERRHEYEYVYVDDEGNEVEVDESELRAAPPASKNGRTNARQSRAAAGPRIQPPSWRRVATRGAIFAPLMFITVMFLDSRLSLIQVALQTALLMAVFLPFSYFIDSLMYRRYQRRIGAEPDSRRTNR